MAIESGLVKKIKALEDENRLLLSDIDIIYKRIGVIKTEQAQNRLLDLTQKKNKELMRQTEVQALQIELLQKTLECERKNNFEDELLSLLEDCQEGRISQLDLLDKLQRFRLSRRLMEASVDERNFNILHELYEKEGLEALEASLDEEGFYGSLRADIYLFLAQKSRLEDSDLALDFARMAWEANPVPKRSLELAFAYWSADKAVHAIACLELLPENYEYSSEEERILASTIKQAKFI